MAYNSKLKGSEPGGYGQGTRTIRGMVASGADLMPNMYDIKIWFPGSDGRPNEAAGGELSYPITVRATGFDVPDVEAEVYEIEYHGVKIHRPKTAQTFTREFALTFREDAAFDLRKRFSAWLMAVVDPVTGGVSNATNFFGRVSVGTIVGEYFATTVAPPGSPDQATGIERKDGYISNQINPVAEWNFYNVWVSKVASPKFTTAAGDALQFEVGFKFMDVDLPQFGGNALLGENWAWAMG
jgi:hypothetical protein